MNLYLHLFGMGIKPEICYPESDENLRVQIQYGKDHYL